MRYVETRALVELEDEASSTVIRRENRSSHGRVFDAGVLAHYSSPVFTFSFFCNLITMEIRNSNEARYARFQFFVPVFDFLACLFCSFSSIYFISYETIRILEMLDE